MGVKQIFVVFDRRFFSKENLQRDFNAEGYPFQFSFQADKHKECNLDVLKADEVWKFGVIMDIPEYEMAVKTGKDIWSMG